MKPLFLILVDGPMGSGKTTTTKLLNEKLPDAARVALADIKRLIPNHGKSEKAVSVAREIMNVMIETYLECGVSVIVEHITKTEGVESLKNIADTHSAAFFAYRMNAPKEVRMQRVLERTREMMGVEALPESKITELEGYFKPNDQFYADNPSNLVSLVDTENLKPEEVVETILSKIS